jgi:acetate---CoA ligase (ADP-forming)
VSGVAEAYAGVIDDPHHGPAVVFGLGGLFVEVLKDTAIEIAPLTQEDALAMIHRIKAAPLFLGARGRPRGDIDALATLLVNLSRFAAAHPGQIKALDLNPIIVRPQGEGAVAVDIAVEINE